MVESGTPHPPGRGWGVGHCIPWFLCHQITQNKEIYMQSMIVTVKLFLLHKPIQNSSEGNEQSAVGLWNRSTGISCHGRDHSLVVTLYNCNVMFLTLSSEYLFDKIHVTNPSIIYLLSMVMLNECQSSIFCPWPTCINIFGCSFLHFVYGWILPVIFCSLIKLSQVPNIKIVSSATPPCA